MKLLLEFFTVIIVCSLSIVGLEKMSVSSPWTIIIGVAAGLIAGRLVNPNSYKKSKDN